MMLSDEKLFLEKLNPEIPELFEVQSLYRAGESTSARKALVAYFKDIARKNLAKALPESDLIPEDKEKTLAWADEILEGWVSSCGMRYKFEDGIIDWAKNPTYNDYLEWPMQFARHEEFATLASAYHLTKDDKYIKRLVYMMRSWLDQAKCPYDDGASVLPYWRALEAGLRLGSFLYNAWNKSIFVFLDSPLVDEQLWLDIIRSIWEHGYCLRNFYQPSTGNPFIMEMNGLAYIALIYPIFVESSEWLEFVDRRLLEELELQIYPDGFQCELTTGYQWCVQKSYLGYFDILARFDKEIPEKMRKVVMEMSHAYVKIIRPDGLSPDINDGFTHCVKELLSYALPYAKGDPVLSYFATDGKEGHLPEYKSVAMPYSGFAISRTGWGENDIYSFFESAPFGRAHAHEDKLGFYLHAYGKSLLADSGNYDYDKSVMRNFVLTTYSHNTALVDYLGQRRGKTHKWDPVVINDPSDLAWSFGEDFDTYEGEYSSGYGRDLLQVNHHRKVIFFKKGLGGAKPFFVIVDSFAPHDESEHIYEVLFQLGTEPITELEQGVTAHHADGVTLTLISTANPVIKIGETEPRFMGWRANRTPSLTEREHFPAPAVLFTENGKDARVVTVVYPTNEERIPVKAVELCDKGFALVFDNGERYEIDENAPEFATRSAESYLKDN